MALLTGLFLGAGLFLVWWSCWETPKSHSQDIKETRLRRLIIQSGMERIGPAGVVTSSILLALFVLTLVFALTRTFTVSMCFGIFGSMIPWLVLKWQAGKRSVQMREIWPDAIDHLRSAIRAGMTLPEALGQLAEQGPEELRSPLGEFHRDYQSGMRFLDAMDQLKLRMADPVADRLVAALKMTREVGGADIGNLLGTLSEFLRDDARTRSELETRQSWTVNGARLAVAAPWAVLLLLATQPQAIQAYQSVTGVLVLFSGLVISAVCYQLMLKIGALPKERRVL